MALLVQKFGGTSVADVERIQAVASRIASCRDGGHELVAVVSAMGHTTDELTRLAAAICPDPPRREMDMLLATGEQVSIALLSMALHSQGVPAVSMTGPQVGIITESTHGRARILEVRTERLHRLLEQGFVHRIASLNAFVGCSDPGHRSSCQFLICDGCGAALELWDTVLAEAIERASTARGFAGHRHTVEIAGRCPTCQ